MENEERVRRKVPRAGEFLEYATLVKLTLSLDDKIKPCLVSSCHPSPAQIFCATRNQALFEDPQVDQIMTLTTHDP